MCIHPARSLARSTSLFLPIGHWSWKLSPRCFSSLAPFGLTPCCQMVTRVRRHLFSCAIVWHFGTWFSQFRWILPMDMILSHMHPLAHGIGWFDIKWFACHVNTTVGWKHCTFLSFGKLSVLFLELKVWKGLNVWVMKQPISRLWGDCGTTKAPFAQDCCDLVPWHLRAEQFALSLLSSHNKLSCIITHDTHDS